MKQLEYNGQKHISLKSVHRANTVKGISYAAFYGRYLRGWGLREALTTPVQQRVLRIFTVDGLIYRGMQSVAETTQQRYETIVGRCRRGWSDEEIVKGRKKKPKIAVRKESRIRGHTVQVEGVTYGNLRKAYDALKPKVAFGTLRKRLSPITSKCTTCDHFKVHHFG